MNRLITFAAASEAATGLMLLIVPSLVGRLLFGAELTGVSIPVARVTGIALTALGLACWSGSQGTGIPTGALRGMLGYSILATLYLAYLGICGQWVGSLLWPAAAIHAILTSLLARAWLTENGKKG